MEAASHQFRVKASRDPYRRAGLVLGSAAWVEFDARELGEEKIHALVADPVISIQRLVGEEWVSPTAEERQLAQRPLRVFEAADVAEPVDLDDLKSRLGYADLKVEQLLGTAERAASDEAALRGQLSEANATIDALQVERKALQEDVVELGTLRDQVEALQTARAALQPDLDALPGLRDQVATLTAELEAAKAKAPAKTPSKAKEPAKDE
ncbi:hypothetical protein [Caulobacter soli]|uniref:hypothetical protein n=1 Tax=Caulobacter soli TaxID=2708539 RepID=UPI0013EDAE81|nr:hypothetical protein [Caulobacter soli]